MTTTTKAQRLADTIRHWGGVTPHQVADELLRLEARVAELEAQELARLRENGRKAWAFLGERSASDWVDEIRGNDPEDCAKLNDEIARLKFDLENATESRKLAQQALYDARERFQKEVSSRTAEISRLLKERQDCEPFGYFRAEPFGWTDCAPDAEGAIALYAAPPKREPLSDKEIVRIHSALQHGPEDTPWSWDFKQGFRAAEKAHGIGGQS